VLIAYKQPITRGEIEHVRGVAVSTNIIKTLLEREWVRVVGHRDVPGKPALYATTKSFLDYFNLTSLEELPTLAEIRDLDKINPELDLQQPEAEDRLPGDGESVSAEELQQQVAEALDSDSQAGIEQQAEITGEQAATTEDLEAEIEEAIDSNQDDRDDVMLDEHDKEIESRLIAEEEELIAATEAAVDDEIVAEAESMATNEVPQEDLLITDQSESSMDDDIVDEAAPDEEQALETTTVDSDEYSDSDELGSKFGS